MWTPICEYITIDENGVSLNFATDTDKKKSKRKKMDKFNDLTIKQLKKMYKRRKKIKKYTGKLKPIKIKREL